MLSLALDYWVATTTYWGVEMFSRPGSGKWRDSNVTPEQKVLAPYRLGLSGRAEVLPVDGDRLLPTTSADALDYLGITYIVTARNGRTPVAPRVCTLWELIPEK